MGTQLGLYTQALGAYGGKVLEAQRALGLTGVRPFGTIHGDP